LQIGSLPEGKGKTLEKILGYEEDIKKSGASVVVLPEALLGGYPKGSIFGTYVGYRLPEGRDMFARYYENAIDVPGAESEEIAAMSQRTRASIVIGVIERAGNTLYCTALFFDPKEGLVAKHRKLMPTAAERLIWGQGDGSTIPVIETGAGKIGAAICWENFMPLLRMTMYSKGIEIWCAPTVDTREVWQTSMRHIAYEGRCFLISACQVQPSPKALGVEVPHWDPDLPLMHGNSIIVNPYGEILAGPLKDEEGLVVSTIDTDELVKARYDFDVAGHYSRPDVFTLAVDEREKKCVEFSR
jgi:nitrilase